jgi:hypothetical protein
MWPWRVDLRATLAQAAGLSSAGAEKSVGAETSTQVRQECSSPFVPPDSPPVMHSVAQAGIEADVPTKYDLVCKKRRDFLDNDPTVKFMLQKLEEVCAEVTNE